MDSAALIWDNHIFCVSACLFLQLLWRSTRTSLSIRAGSTNTLTSASPNLHSTANMAPTLSGSPGELPVNKCCFEPLRLLCCDPIITIIRPQGLEVVLKWGQCDHFVTDLVSLLLKCWIRFWLLLVSLSLQSLCVWTSLPPSLYWETHLVSASVSASDRGSPPPSSSIYYLQQPQKCRRADGWHTWITGSSEPPTFLPHLLCLWHLYHHSSTWPSDSLTVPLPLSLSSPHPNPQCPNPSSGFSLSFLK